MGAESGRENRSGWSRNTGIRRHVPPPFWHALGPGVSRRQLCAAFRDVTLVEV
jgi:hypothetical protein